MQSEQTTFSKCKKHSKPAKRPSIKYISASMNMHCNVTSRVDDKETPNSKNLCLPLKATRKDW